MQARSKLARVVDGQRIIVDDPPLLVRVVDEELREQIDDILQIYRSTLQDDRRQLLDQYRFVDMARKVVEVGSVGTRDYIMLLEWRDEDDPLFLQAKEAEASVLESYRPKSTYKNHGHRVIAAVLTLCIAPRFTTILPLPHQHQRVPIGRTDPLKRR